MARSNAAREFVLEMTRIVEEMTEQLDFRARNENETKQPTIG